MKATNACQIHWVEGALDSFKTTVPRADIESMIMMTYSRYGDVYGPIDSVFTGPPGEEPIIDQWNKHWLAFIQNHPENNNIDNIQMPVHVPVTSAALIAIKAPTSIPVNLAKVFILTPPYTENSKVTILQTAMPIEHIRANINLASEKVDDATVTTVMKIYALLPKSHVFDNLADTLTKTFTTDLVMTRI